MKVWFRSAVCAVAASLAAASAAHALTPVQTAYPYEATSASAVDLSQSLSLPAASYGPPGSGRLAVANVATSISLITGLDLELGYKVGRGDRIDPFDASNAHTFDGLFLSSASAAMPYMSLADGGNLFGVAAAVADDLHVKLAVGNLEGATTASSDAYTALARLGGEPSPYAPRTSNSLLAGVNWSFAGWGDLGVMASQSDERNGLLGQAAPGTNASTSALGVSARLHFGNGWVTTATYSEGVTQLDLRPGLSIASIASTDPLRTRSYGIAIAKNGLFGDDMLGFAVSRPALGGSDFTLTSAQDGQRFFARNNILAGTTPETDIEVGYVTTFLDGSVALQANASYQMNYAGQNGANAVSLLSRARIKF
ncbi:MAG: hypothetical protein ISS15_02280 [Alphaproteobacteria bacterium]|nr:hypothetical protein [Alphaproteobacteria bacterium]MBL6938401.1 hypothetical protein [Alphaproteobacteria bacterium]MBL7096460.1 hypothetical protein [Alphaproteobacteria bacterium]